MCNRDGSGSEFLRGPPHGDADWVARQVDSVSRSAQLVV